MSKKRAKTPASAHSWVNKEFKMSGRRAFPPPKRRPVFYRGPAFNWCRSGGKQVLHVPGEDDYPGPINDINSPGYDAEARLRQRDRRPGV